MHYMDLTKSRADILEYCNIYIYYILPNACHEYTKTLKPICHFCLGQHLMINWITGNFCNSRAEGGNKNKNKIHKIHHRRKKKLFRAKRIAPRVIFKGDNDIEKEYIKLLNCRQKQMRTYIGM